MGSKIRLEIIGIVAEGNKVAVEVRSHGALHNGNPYKNSYHELYEIRDERVALCKEHTDMKYSAEIGIRPKERQ